MGVFLILELLVNIDFIFLRALKLGFELVLLYSFFSKFHPRFEFWVGAF